jgi:RNA polymerase sigma-70 factor (ECF subfamily)
MGQLAGISFPTRRSLLAKIKDPGNDDAWLEFYGLYRKLIYAVAVRAGLNHQEAQEVIADTMLCVCRKIVAFEYDPTKGKFKGWLLQLTRWRIDDQFRKRAGQVRQESPNESNTRTTLTVARIPDPHGGQFDVLWEEQWRRSLLEAALKAVKTAVSSLYYQIFDLHVLKELPAEKVAKMLGIKRQQVYLAKLRVSKRVTKEIRRLEGTL